MVNIINELSKGNLKYLPLELFGVPCKTLNSDV